MDHGNTIGAATAFGTQYAQGIPENPPTDLDLQIKHVNGLIHRLQLVHGQLSGQIGRLYGEGDPPSSEEKAMPQPVGAHHEMSISLARMESAVANVEAKVERLSRYA